MSGTAIDNNSHVGFATNNGLERKRKTSDSESEQAVTKRPVPQIVKVDMGDSDEDTHHASATASSASGAASASGNSVVPATTTTTIPRGSPSTAANDRELPKYVDWRLLCDRAVLKRLLQGPSKVTNGTLYLKFDKSGYETLDGGGPVDLGEYSHLRVQTPFMQNLFGLSSKVTKGKWSHSILFDVGDSTVDKQVPRFTQFLAMCDDVCLEICTHHFVTSPFFEKAAQQAIRFASASGTLDMKEVSNIVASQFNGALRIAQKTDEDKSITDKKVEKIEENKYRVPTVFFFKTKIWAKKDNEKMPDIVTYNMNNKQVHWSTETAAFKLKDKDGEVIKPVLTHPRATYVKAQIELPAIYYIGNVFHGGWNTTKIKYQTRSQVEKTVSRAADNVADFDDQEAPVYATAADLERVQREEANALYAATNLDNADA